jgi:hypothetical protein
MRKPLLAPRVPIILTLILAFAATDAQALSDLTIDSASLWGDTTVLPHREISVHFEISNAGDEDSGEFWLRFYLSTDDTITEDDDWRASRSGSNLPPGGVLSDYRYVDLPSDIRRGDYYIGVMIVPQDSTDIKTSTAGSITILRPTDLGIQGVHADAGTRPGDQIDVVVSVHNDGIGISDSFTIDCYAGDFSIGSGDFGPLYPGEMDSFEVSCAFPSDISEGDYYVRAVVSCPYDDNSGNNEGGAPDSIWVGPSVDMAVQSVQVTPGPYLPGEDFVVYSVLKNIGERDSGNYVVDYYVSTNAGITDDDHHIGHIESTALAAGEQHNHETMCSFPFNIPPGNYHIGIIVTSEDEYDPANNVGRNAATVGLAHPAGYVCGQVQYQYKWNWDRRFPVRYALVEIYEDDNNNDPLDDRLIGQTHTDRNGNYAITVIDDDNRGHDIYVKVVAEGVSGAYPRTESKIGVVKDDVFDETYSLVSGVHPHPQDSSVVVNMMSPGSGEFMVFDSIVEGFAKAKTFLDIELEQVTTYWPSEEGFSYYDPCDGGIYISQDDRGDRDVIMHEYGHYVADVYGVGQGPIGENAMHFWNLDLRSEPVPRTDEHAMNLAFREAWASLFSIATQYGDTSFPSSGSSVYHDLDEASNWTLKADLENDSGKEYSPGQYFENMNACALWDIFDDKNDTADADDTLSDPSLLKIWTISRDYKPENIVGFWNSWFRNYDDERVMKSIFEAHEMPFVKPDQ